jgi:type VI secretion system secreted protein VgrG
MDATLLSADRHVRVSTSLPAVPLLFEAMSGEETLGRPFAYEVDVLSDSTEIDLHALLGQRMTVHLDMALGVRHFNGVITEFRAVGATHRFYRYRASLRPEISLLAYTADCRIFQKMSARQIIERVLKSRSVTFSSQSLAGTPPPLEYVVQYRESDLNFVSRLMEWAGIYYRFEHEDGKHTMILLNDVSACKGSPGYEVVPFIATAGVAEVNPDHISAWTAGARLVPGQFTVRDFRHDQPKALPTGTSKTLIQTAGAPRAGAELDVFDYPGINKTVDEGHEEAVARLQEHESWFTTAEAHGDTRGLGIGHVFKIIDLPRHIQSDKSYLVVKANYSLQTTPYDNDSTLVEQKDYQAWYTLIDSKTEYRTPRDTPKPRMAGPQTATVVGHKDQPKDDEICTDDEGRVLVKFHWDRRGEDTAPPDDDEDKDKDQSCFVRVSQVWAGAGWGAMHIPRIGQEVIVDFLEGDPDRPIITGRVYNGLNPPPYPKNPTQSGIKSRSTKGAGPNNFNEIRFEDKKGSEELFIQAEKTQTTKVKGSQSISVDGDRSVTVGGNESITVTGERSTSVKKKDTQTYADAQIISVKLTEDLTVGDKLTETFKGGRETTVEKYDTTVVKAANKNINVDQQYNLDAKEHISLVQKGTQIFVKDQVYVKSVGDIQLKNDGCHVNAENAGTLILKATQQIQIECGAAKITLKMDGSIVLDGVTGIQATSGPTSLKLGPDGSVTQAPKVGVTGMSMVEIAAPVVKVG